MTAEAPERLNRFLARRGVASRRAADALIAAGRVTVNGRPGQVGAQVSPSRDRVCVDDVDVRPETSQTLLLNKPPGVVSTRRDPGGRPTVMDLVPDVPGLVPVGRLDADSRGLLLLTTDGDLAHRVAHPRHGVRKRYLVRLAARATDAQLGGLLAGITLEDGRAHAVAARRAGHAAIEVAMAEGRKREVRRMCAALGMEVRDLVRTAIGPLELGDLPEGDSRPVTADEEARLRAAVGLRPDAAAAGPTPGATAEDSRGG